MVQFIHQEAREKAAEIKLKTDEEFNIEKLRMVEAEKQKIRADYERKEKQEEVKKRMCVPCRQSPRTSTHQPSFPPLPILHSHSPPRPRAICALSPVRHSQWAVERRARVAAVVPHGARSGHAGCPRPGR